MGPKKIAEIADYLCRWPEAFLEGTKQLEREVTYKWPSATEQQIATAMRIAAEVHTAKISPNPSEMQRLIEMTRSRFGYKVLAMIMSQFEQFQIEGS